MGNLHEFEASLIYRARRWFLERKKAASWVSIGSLKDLLGFAYYCFDLCEDSFYVDYKPNDNNYNF